VASRSKSWAVVFDSNAVIDFEDVKNRGERKAVFNAVHKLRELGPDLPPPHMKSLKGETDLFELRPRQGNSPVRPIYVRLKTQFVVLAVAPKKSDFDRAVQEAKERSEKHR
jgi:hypothetical protein